MIKDLKCPICGEPTSSYMGNYRKDRLCKKHALDLKNGVIEIVELGFDEADNTYRVVKNNKVVEPKNSFVQWFLEDENKKGVCVVCGLNAKHRQCVECFKETRDYMDGLDKNASISEFRQYYYNLKDYIFRIKDFERVKTNCNKLIAIAIADKNSNSDTALFERVYKDVQDLIEKKQKHLEDKTVDIREVKEEKDKETQVHFNYSTDGHALDSDMEVKIDDILYSSEIFHCCHKPVTDITEKAIVSDWFIPIDSINKGIYIEYNGMDTLKYKKNKEENVALYRKHNIPLIIIEKDEPKNDTQTFTAHLIKEIQSKAIEFFGGMPKWRK